MLKQDTLENSKPSNPGKDCSSWIAIFLSPACNVQASCNTSHRLVTLWQKTVAMYLNIKFVGAFSQQLRAALQACMFKLM